MAWLLVIDKVIHGKIKIFSGRTFTRHKGRSLMLCVIVCAHILTLVEPWNWFEIKCLIALKFVIRIIVIKSDVMLFTVKISFQMCHARTETSFVRCFVELSLFYSISFFFLNNITFISKMLVTNNTKIARISWCSLSMSSREGNN